MLDGLVDEESRLLPRPILAKQRDEGRLAGIRVSAGGLAGRGLVATMIDEIVRDLESQANIARVAAIGRSYVERHLGHDAGRLDRIFDQGAGLELLKPGDCRKIELLSFSHQ